jgi:hypothetical protein
VKLKKRDLERGGSAHSASVAAVKNARTKLTAAEKALSKSQKDAKLYREVTDDEIKQAQADVEAAEKAEKKALKKSKKAAKAVDDQAGDNKNPKQDDAAKALEAANALVAAAKDKLAQLRKDAQDWLVAVKKVEDEEKKVSDAKRELMEAQAEAKDLSLAPQVEDADFRSAAKSCVRWSFSFAVILRFLSNAAIFTTLVLLTTQTWVSSPECPNNRNNSTAPPPYPVYTPETLPPVTKPFTDAINAMIITSVILLAVRLGCALVSY